MDRQIEISDRDGLSSRARHGLAVFLAQGELLLSSAIAVAIGGSQHLNRLFFLQEADPIIGLTGWGVVRPRTGQRLWGLLLETELKSSIDSAGANAILSRPAATYGPSVGEQRLVSNCLDTDSRRKLEAGATTKAEGGFDLVAPEIEAVKAERVGLTSDLSAQAAFQSICEACLRHYFLNEERVLAGGGAEAVHQCRVALRRLRSALTIFRPLMTDPESRTLRRRLKRAARVFGDPRNIDVLIKRSGSDAPIADLLDYRAKLYAGLLSELRSPAFRNLLLDLVTWVAVGDWTCSAATASARRQPIKLFAKSRLGRIRRRVKKAGAHFRHLDAAGRHAVRIETKTFRYATEFFADLFVSEAEAARRDAFLVSLEALQNALGRLNDQTTGDALCRRLDISPVSDRPKKKRLLIKAAANVYRTLMERTPFWKDCAASISQPRS